METIYFEKISELRRTKSKLEKDLNVKITLTGKRVSIKGPALEEYEALQVLEAMNFGFSAEKALEIKEPDIAFRVIHIRDFTRRKNLKDVKARIIGKQGKTKKTIEGITSSYIIIKENRVGVIGSTESIEAAITGITNVIKGSKQSNVYRYLEKINRGRKEEGLGLKD